MLAIWNISETVVKAEVTLFSYLVICSYIKRTAVFLSLKFEGANLKPDLD